jgi:hypothetical protein
MGQAIVRLVLGVLGGLVTMFIVIMGIEFLGHQVYPPPPGLDPRNTADVARIMAQAPVGALASIAIAWIVGALAGGFVAAKVSGFWPRAAAIVVGLFVVLGVVAMMTQVPGHPMWLAIVGLVLPVPMALLGARLAQRRPASVP